MNNFRPKTCVSKIICLHKKKVAYRKAIFSSIMHTAGSKQFNSTINIILAIFLGTKFLNISTPIGRKIIDFRESVYRFTHNRISNFDGLIV